ncbi:MAG: cohesin domain-containing protein, partial [Candidatus Methanomethylicaceae archaeon]
RVIGSQATLDTVLAEDGKSRVRFGSENQRPFGWISNPKFNAVMSYQFDPYAQDYLPEEIKALKEFVENGGGLIIIGAGIHRREDVLKWPINSLAKEFGASITERSVRGPFSCSDPNNELVAPLEVPNFGTYPSLSIDSSWRTLLKGSQDEPLLAVREFGKGRVAIISDMEITKWGKDSAKNLTRSKKANGTFLHSLLYWICANRPPVGGTRNLPMEAAGGGPIYPDQETDVGSITIFYAKNQKEYLINTVQRYMPEVKAKIESWLPSAPPKDRMYLILSSGGGGGWAVNVYEPKEVGIIMLDQEGVLSVFAHELAHTMFGPPNDKGEIAGILPDLFSEAHAGWFQGKIEDWRTGKRDGHEPNRLFDIDKDGKGIDITKLEVKDYEKGWIKLWWIFQKLDERYGPVWYPRWLWVKNTRWMNEPYRRLTWDEVVEDMSIAVGEDLFPFFRNIGTTLRRERFAEAEFLGKKLTLPVAPIKITRTGKAILTGIGDYKEEIVVPDRMGIFIKPKSISVKKGDAFAINIDVYKVVDLFGVSFELQFDPKILSTFDAKTGDAMGNDALFLSMPSDGKINIAISKKQGSSPFSGSGTLVTIGFKAVEDGKTEINFDKSKLVLQKSDGSPISGMEDILLGTCQVVVKTEPVQLAELSFEPSVFNVYPEDKFEVKLQVKDVEELFGAAFKITYDSRILNVVKVSNGGFMGEDVIFFSQVQDNCVSIAISKKAGAKGSGGSGNLAIIEFQAKASGKSDILYEESTLTLTKSDGKLIPFKVNNGTINVNERKITKGDVNGDGKILSNDAILALRISAGMMEATPEQFKSADMNDDGKVGANDAILILRRAAGLAAPTKNTIAKKGEVISIMLAETHGTVGENVIMPISVSKTDNLMAGDIRITYDSSVLCAVKVLPDQNLLMESNTSKPGVVQISFASINKLNSKTIAKIVFTIISDRTSPISLQSVELYNDHAMPINSRKLDGKFSPQIVLPVESALLQNFP